MSVLTRAELDYLGERRLARIATVGPDGTPHVCPVGMWRLERDDVLVVTGHDFARSKKFRDVARTGRASLVVDDIVSTDPWHVRGLEVRGRAEAAYEPEAAVRIHPQRVVAWGVEDAGTRYARDTVESRE